MNLMACLTPASNSQHDLRFLDRNSWRGRSSSDQPDLRSARRSSARLSRIRHAVLSSSLSRISLASLFLFLFASLLPGLATANSVLWIDDDWSNGNYEWVVEIDPEAHPGFLVLENRPEDMRLLGQPTSYDGIYAMAVHNDVLYLGAGNYPLLEDGADVLIYDNETGEFSLSYELYEQGVVAIKTYGETLYIPGADSQGSHQWGNFYFFDGLDWTRKETIPQGVHIFDLAVLGDVIYATGGLLDTRGAVWRSQDGGDTFEEIYDLWPDGQGYRRFYAAEVFQGHLFVQHDGMETDGDYLLEFDGTSWIRHEIPGLPDNQQGIFTVWGDSLLLNIGRKMYVYDGQSWVEEEQPFNGDRWCRGVGIYGDALYGGAENGLLYKWTPGNGWTSVCQLGPITEGEEIQAVVDYHGRLFVATANTITQPGGRVYVSASVTIGRMASRIHDFESRSQGGLLSWDGARPSQSSEIRLRLRSGRSIEDLEAMEFVGPDGAPGSYYTNSGTVLPPVHRGHRYFQYQVELTCPDGDLMPFLRNVTLEVEPRQAVADVELPDGSLPSGIALWMQAPQPNPARSATEMRILTSPGTGLETEMEAYPVSLPIRVHDAQGRLVRSDDLPVAGTDALSWQWSLTNDHGDPVPSGVYWISIAGLEAKSEGFTQRSVVVLR